MFILAFYESLTNSFQEIIDYFATISAKKEIYVRVLSFAFEEVLTVTDRVVQQFCCGCFCDVLRACPVDVGLP